MADPEECALSGRTTEQLTKNTHAHQPRYRFLVVRLQYDQHSARRSIAFNNVYCMPCFVMRVCKLCYLFSTLGTRTHTCTRTSYAKRPHNATAVSKYNDKHAECGHSSHAFIYLITRRNRSGCPRADPRESVHSLSSGKVSEHELEHIVLWKSMSVHVRSYVNNDGVKSLIFNYSAPHICFKQNNLFIRDRQQNYSNI